MGTGSKVEFLIAPYYNCVGDVFHDYLRRSSFPYP